MKECAWVQRAIWTDRMLETLDKGVKGGVWYSMIDKLWHVETLRLGWQQVKANKGAAGSDHQSIAQFEAREDQCLERLAQELRTGTYRPRPIKRVHIAKPGTREKRPLGIPAVRDRVVQSALRMMIEPIFEKQFAANSYGFRPERGCKDALREVDGLLSQGYYWVVDADLRKYFDTIPHKALMNEIRKSVADGRILDLIKAYLTQGVLEGLRRWTPEQGTPQGSVISPLLANVYMHPIDVAMEAKGYKMIRYADDFVILCRNRQQAETALEVVNRLVTDRGLRLHEHKTCVVDVRQPGQGFDFLGYHFGWSNHRGKHAKWPKDKSVAKLRQTIRPKTRRSNGRSMEAITADLNKTLRGWFEYYKHSTPWAFVPIDQWIRMRLRSILRKRRRRRGRGRGYDHHRWPNSYFRDLGLVNLFGSHRTLLQSSRG
jgi:RNA-directed DNA polymerase